MVEIEVIQGPSPLILGLPHTGTYVPSDIADRLNERGQGLSDTDWHVDRLYVGLVPDVTTVRTPVHRYAIDVNRDPSGHSLYPGQNTTSLCPLTDFDGAPLYLLGAEPGTSEIERRRALYHAPYHAALTREMTRIVALHGFAILYDCHSIRSEIPYLFDGRLPDFNIGTNMGQTCAPSLEDLVREHCDSAEPYTSVLNGRFRGGWSTRHYGRPELGWHAIQMELAQATYMEEHPPWTYLPARATEVRCILRSLLSALSEWRPQ